MWNGISARSSRPSELHTINDMIGMPIYYNLALVPTDNVSGMDAEILIQLSEGHRPSADYMRTMRRQLPAAFPGSTFYFQTADIVSQVLNFGLAAPLDVQIQGADINKSYDIGAPAAGVDGENSRRGGRPYPAGDVLSGPEDECRPPARRRSRPHPARCGQQHADQPVIQRRCVALLLAQPRQWRELFRRGADAAAAGLHRVGADEHADGRRQHAGQSDFHRTRRAHPAAVRTSPKSRPIPTWNPSTITPCSG